MDIPGLGFSDFSTQTLDICFDACCTNPDCLAIQYSESVQHCVLHGTLGMTNGAPAGYNIIVKEQCIVGRLKAHKKKKKKKKLAGWRNGCRNTTIHPSVAANHCTSFWLIFLFSNLFFYFRGTFSWHFTTSEIVKDNTKDNTSPNVVTHNPK